MTPHHPPPRAVGLRIFASELAVIVDEISAHPRIETGGDLLGLWSHGDAPTVFLATRPGPRAIRERMHFQQDPRTHRDVERLAWEQLGLQVVGMWHSHHELGLHELSRGDLARTMRYAGRYRRDRFVDVLGYFDRGLVLKPFVYRDAAIGRSEWSRIHPLPGHSPARAALAALAPPELAGALRDAPVGPTRRWRAEKGPPLWPARAPAEGEGDEALTLPAHADTPGRGPWRAVDAVERLVAERVPDALLESMELDVLPGGLVLRLAAGERSLSMGLAFDGRLAVQGWEIAGPRPISGRSGGDVGTTLDLAVRALTEG